MNQNVNKTKWTPSQEKAISTEGKHLLVAAGAGSGKTSVLTQRLVDKIKSGSDIDSFLVVTFTVASADDMKEKLRKKLVEEYSQNPDNKHLSNQIAKLPFAKISTISAYCMRLIKQNFTVLNLSPSVRTADEGEAIKLFGDAFELLLDEKFRSGDKDLYKILNETNCFGKEDRLFAYLDKIYSKLRAHPDYIKKLNITTETLTESADIIKSGGDPFDTSAGTFILECVKYLLDSIDEDAKKLLIMVENSGDELEAVTKKYVGYFEDGKSYASKRDFIKSAACFKNGKDLYKSAWRKTSIFSGLDESEKMAYNQFRKSARDKAENLSELLLEIGEKSAEDIIKCAEIGESLKNIISSLDEIYSNLKREKDVIDFADAEQFTYKLLFDENGNTTSLCNEIALFTEEVLVDEYQDTNPLQDKIFGALAQKNNRFMVGDDKQSIYRFRNAYPVIFNGYKASFHTETEECIFLRENFRCSKDIIDFTNGVFRFLWGDTYKSEELIFAKKGCETSEKVTVKTFLSKANNKEACAIEAPYIAEEISSLMKSYTKEDGSPLEYSDIAILLSTAKDISEIFADELRRHGIPVSSDKGGLLAETPEIKVLLSILMAVNNPYCDIPLASAMNSYMFGFTADELSKIRYTNEISLYDCVLSYGTKRKIHKSCKLKGKRTIYKKAKKKPHFKKSPVSEIEVKCNMFIKKLGSLRERARSIECRQFIWELYENEGILDLMSSLPDGDTKKGNLLLFYNEAIAYGRREHKTLSAFIKHTEKLQTEAYSPDGLNAVSIMTIHASKGLEFPICFLANAGKSLVERSPGIKKPLIHVGTGIFTPLVENELYTRYPVLYQCEEILDKPEELAENKRKLYVALTRAREKLYVVGTASNIDSISNSSPDDATSFLSWVHTARPDATYITKEVCNDETIILEDEEMESESVIEPGNESESEKEYIEELNVKEEEFIYPFSDSVMVPRKLSVSELEAKSKTEYKQTIKKKDFLTVPVFALETKKVSSAEIGTANHTFMQFASFKNCVTLGVEYEADRLLSLDMITEEQYSMLNFKNLKTFFQSDLWKRISKSGKIFREKRFTVSHNSMELLGFGDDEVLVQGVIDLFFENEDGTYTVVDYKTDKIRLGEEDVLSERYKGQLSYYAKAVKEITEKDVKECIIYSFSLGKEIKIHI